MTHFFQHVSHVGNTFKCKCLLLIIIKDKLALLLDKTGYFSEKKNETNVQSKFLPSLALPICFCIKAVHLSNKLSLMCPRLWPIEDICIGLYVLKVIPGEAGFRTDCFKI